MPGHTPISVFFYYHVIVVKAVIFFFIYFIAQRNEKDTPQHFIFNP